MAKQSKSTLKNYFQTGDRPSQAQYADLIDSQVNLAETGTQIMEGALSSSGIKATGDITASGNISSSGTITANSLVGTLSTAAQPNITSLGTLSSLTTSGDITLGSGNAIVNSDSDENIISNGSTGFNIGQSDYPLTIVSNITASGNISASGNITADTLISNNIIFTSGSTSIKIEAPDEPSGNANGADLTIESGDAFGADYNGGNITLQAGKGSGAGDGGNITINAGEGIPSGSVNINALKIILELDNIPTSDPNVAGQLFRDGTDLKISLG